MNWSVKNGEVWEVEENIKKEMILLCDDEKDRLAREWLERIALALGYFIEPM